MSEPLTTIPAPLRPVLDKARDRLAAHDEWRAIVDSDAQVAALLDRVLACSEYVADVLARWPQTLADVIADGRMHRSLASGDYDTLFAAEAPDTEAENAFMRRLRLFRHRELMRIIFRDLAGWSDTAETLADLSSLADACIRAALAYSGAEMQKRHGVPRDRSGDEAVLVVVAMGKLGGGELNLSSDVDVVFIYSGSGETDGSRTLANEEYFRRLAQHFINLLSKKTADGFVYRVDARLRPFGDSGPLACSVGALEDYLVQHGRDWERYAWVKARAVNAWAGTRDFYVNVLRPFVYRRYLDFGVFGSLREMKSMIEQEGRAAENRENIKLGPGGIREIEFIVQTLQLVRGGSLKSLRERRLQPALQALGDEGLMPAETVDELARAYSYLRDVENRIQAIADRQTHELPANDVDRARLLLAMNHSEWDEFYSELNRQRDVVKTDFDQILRHERNREDNDPLPESADRDSLLGIAEHSFADPEEAVNRIEAFRGSGLYKRMDEISQQRLDRLVPAMLQACGASGGKGLQALERMLRIIEAIGRRSAYFALLNENPAVLERLVRLCSSSDFLARQVAAHPLLLDELIDPRMFLEAPVREDFESDIRQRLEAVSPDDTEQRYEALRNFQQAAVFRVAVADLSGILPLMKVSDRLTEIAELVLQEAQLGLAIDELRERHGTPRCVVNGESRAAGFAIAGYGKLGGWELGYGSDLDIVFIHDSDGDEQVTDGEKPLDNAVFFGRVARRITTILTMHTPTGPLYEVDTRLRPSGKSGLLVTSLKALDAYQKDDAWTWEHQALLRARAVAGARSVCTGFETLRVHALTEYVRRDTLKDEVVTMRDRMRGELSKSTTEMFDLKQGEGGMIDIEFLVQYLVLLHAPEHPPLLVWADNIRQLEALEAAGLLSTDEAGELADTYRAYRTQVHLLALAGEPRLVPHEVFASQASAVQALWQRFLG